MAALIRCRGLRVVDMGVSVEAEKFIEAAIGADYYAGDITAVAEIAASLCRRSLKAAA